MHAQDQLCLSGTAEPHAEGAICYYHVVLHCRQAVTFQLPALVTAMQTLSHAKQTLIRHSSSRCAGEAGTGF